MDKTNEWTDLYGYPAEMDAPEVNPVVTIPVADYAEMQLKVQEAEKALSEKELYYFCVGVRVTSLQMVMEAVTEDAWKHTSREAVIAADTFTNFILNGTIPENSEILTKLRPV